MSTPSEPRWLSELFKYQQTADKTPLENFQTTLFGWMLSTNRPFRQRVLEALFINSGDGSLDFCNEPFEITPQYRAPCKTRPLCVPDLFLKSRNFVAYVEHKVGSEFSPHQLDRYREAIKCEVIESNKRFVAYIGRTLPPDLPDWCAKLTWCDVYKIAKLDTEFASSTLGGAILHFMEEHSMGEQKPLNIGNVKTIPTFREFIESASRLVDEVCGQVRPKVDGLEIGEPEQDKRPSYYGRRLLHDRGKFGIYLYFPEEELSVLLYMTRPESDATDGEKHQVQKCKAAGWKDMKENGYRGVALEEPLSATWAGKPFPTGKFDEQVHCLAAWAIQELKKVLERDESESTIRDASEQ
jgi:hypothetical protein